MIKIVLIHHDLYTAKKIKHFIMSCCKECSIRLFVPKNTDELMKMIEEDPGQIDVCFTEIKLNRFSAFGFVKKLRTLNPKVKVSVFSDTKEYAMEAWESGINEYLLEPITLEKIQNSIKNLQVEEI